MLRNLVTMGAGLLALAGCAGDTPIVQPPVPYTATRALHERGTTEFSVRTQVRRAGISFEVSGVPCSFQADGFRSSFVTPAVVMAPNMQRRTPVATVTCQRDSETRTVTLEPYNRTISDTHMAYQQATASTGTFSILGSIVGAIAADLELTGRDRSADVHAYRDVTVTFGE